MTNEELQKFIIETIKEYNKSQVFVDRKTTDTPTDAYSLVNRKFVDDLVLDDLSDVAITSSVQGDILYKGTTNWNNLAPGTNGQALTTNGASANPAWQGMTTQGDVEYHDGTDRAKLAPGTNRYTLQTGGASANPSWAPSPQSLMTNQGDIIYANGANTLARLGAGTNGQALTTNGASANPAWQGMTTQGDIEYHDGTDRTRLAPGTSGQFLKTQGASANPVWANSGVKINVTESPNGTGPNNTATETNLVSYTLSGGELGTNNMLYGKIFIGSCDVNQQVTFRLYYGSASISDTVSVTAAVTNCVGYVDYMIVPNNATNDIFMSFRFNADLNEFIGSAAQNKVFSQAVTAGPTGHNIDSTADQTVKFSVQFNAADAGSKILTNHAFAMIIK